MRRLLLWGVVAGFAACLIRPTLATITPEYSYVDGCETVLVQGHHLGTTATARIGDSPFLSLEPAELDRTLPEQAQDVGFLYTGVVPPSPDGKPGWHDVILVVDGEELVIRDGWYYRSCPATFDVDFYVLPPDENLETAAFEVDIGDDIVIQGCGLDDRVRLAFFDAYGEQVTDVPLVPDCLTARVHADVPPIPGTYSMALVHPDGTRSDFCASTGDSGDTASVCEPDLLTIQP
jgi:hypothetical protein